MSVAGKNRDVAEAVAYNALDLVIHTSKGFYAGECAPISGMRFLLATAAGFHGVGAMTAH
jgi:hypothetical protein